MPSLEIISILIEMGSRKHGLRFDLELSIVKIYWVSRYHEFGIVQTLFFKMDPSCLSALSSSLYYNTQGLVITGRTVSLMTLQKLESEIPYDAHYTSSVDRNKH